MIKINFEEIPQAGYPYGILNTFAGNFVERRNLNVNSADIKYRNDKNQNSICYKLFDYFLLTDNFTLRNKYSDEKDIFNSFCCSNGDSNF